MESFAISMNAALAPEPAAVVSERLEKELSPAVGFRTQRLVSDSRTPAKAYEYLSR